jgi:uncharacterized membrane protein (DUF485 family)
MGSFVLKKETVNWLAIEADPRFIQLHKDKNRFLWRMMLFALIYFFCLPIATAYFQDILKIKLWGVINVGLLFALSQFIVAWAIAVIYAKRANTEFDTRAQVLRDDAHNISSNLSNEKGTDA